MSRILLIYAVLFALLLPGCEGMFSYSTYEAGVPDERQSTTIRNIERLKAVDTVALPSFTFAVLSDPHYHYDNLAAAVSHINKSPDVKFVVVTGDLTDQGLMEEFLSFHDVMEKLNKPYFTVIGNHDYLSNGETVYRQLFGERNYTFTFNRKKFILFDDVFWESNRYPDFTWLEHELTNNGHLHGNVVFAHIPPFGDQFTPEDAARYHQAVSGNATISIHGHTHAHYHGNYYDDGLPYFVLPWMKERQYGLVTVGDEGGVNTRMIQY